MTVVKVTGQLTSNSNGHIHTAEWVQTH
jgi:hypothetical protein